MSIAIIYVLPFPKQATSSPGFTNLQKEIPGVTAQVAMTTQIAVATEVAVATAVAVAMA